MPTFINVQNRDEFDQFIAHMQEAKTVVADTETNGLRYYRDNYIISISVYLPELDVAYNLPFKHGEGHVDTRWTKTQVKGASFADMKWSGNAKKDRYLEYWFHEYALENPDFGNLPLEWYDEIKRVWALPDVTYIFHNARFDLHMLEADGFPRPAFVEDTMWLLHVVNGDWREIDVVAPYKYIKSDGRDLEGQWVYTDKDELAVKTQPGNRGLKWHAAFIGLPGATVGEKELRTNCNEMGRILTEFALQYPESPINAGLIYKTEKGREGTGQWDKINSKLRLDVKSNLWMLSSGDVAAYAMLDCFLTWGLREHYWPVLERWNNVKLYLNECDYGYNLCWRMERNGVRIHYENAIQEIEKLDVLLEELDLSISSHFDYAVNVASPAQLKPALIAKGFDITATDKEALEPYEDDPLIAMILEWRKAKKSRDTYLKRWVSGVDAKQIVHPGMNPDGTGYGRLSSSGYAGNFQNIPDRRGYTVKRAIIPYNDNWVFFALDMGQFEARLAAWYAEILLDQPLNMTALFESDTDLHIYTRDTIGIQNILFNNLNYVEICDKLGYNLDELEGTPEQVALSHLRYIAKTMNFGLIYSGGAPMLSKLLRIDADMAAILVAKWRALFPAFRLANDHYTRQALQWRPTPSGDGMGQYVTQEISGRHRKLQMLPKSKWFYERGIRKWFNPQEAASRKVFNNLVQGLAGYICLTSGLRINRLYDDSKLRLFANIHDAIDGYIHVDHMAIIPDMMRIMTDWDVRPRLTVELAGSADGTWQGMRAVENFDLWVDSKGHEGYDELKTL